MLRSRQRPRVYECQRRVPQDHDFFGNDIPSQGFNQCVLLALNLEYLDGLVRRTCREPPAVVIQYGVMLYLVRIGRGWVDVAHCAGWWCGMHECGVKIEADVCRERTIMSS